MKANRFGWFLLFLLASAVFQLPAQQSEADRKLLADIRAKAEKGDAQSQAELGSAFLLGILGVAKDEAEGVKWFRKAAEQNHALAQHNLGVCYAFGEGVAKDYVEAVKWYRKAAEQNLAQAQIHVGTCYFDGQGVTKDEGEAVKWYRKAAEQNHAEAQNNLAVCYAKGDGVAKDKIEAVKWYRKAANQGLGLAQYSLGACYCNGEGVPKDYIEAYKWMNLASAQDDEDAKTYLPFVEIRMTAEQIAEAQRLAREFRPSKRPEATGVLTREQIADSRPSGSGTGFFITEDGFLITNEHVVKEATQVRLVTSAGLISAKVVKVDAANDLALLKAESKFAALPVAASRAVKLGNTVATVGFPNIGLQGFAPKLAKGEIAALSGAQDDARYFQISVPVQPGNSGGALVDERGNVVGVVSAKLSARAALSTSGALPENVNYAVKSSFLLSFLESVPEVSAKLKEPNTKERKFEDVVKSAEQAAVLVLVY
jgi:TPR repeat protein